MVGKYILTQWVNGTYEDKWLRYINRETNKKDFRCELDMPERGFKFHMNDVMATVGIENLKHANEIIEKHIKAHGGLKKYEAIESIKKNLEYEEYRSIYADF